MSNLNHRRKNPICPNCKQLGENGVYSCGSYDDIVMGSPMTIVSDTCHLTALENALSSIDTAASILPSYKVTHEGGFDAYVQNIIDAISAYHESI